jgi:hypothetical protein
MIEFLEFYQQISGYNILSPIQRAKMKYGSCQFHIHRLLRLSRASRRISPTLSLEFKFQALDMIAANS